MATRLTKVMRSKILYRLLDHRFKAEQEEMDKALTAFESSVYNDIYPEKIRKAMLALPDDYLRSGGNLTVGFGGEITQIRIPQTKPVSNGHCGYSRVVKSYEAKDELTLEWRNISRRKADYRTKRDRATTAAKGVLENCRTIKQLLEAWPESLPFVQDYMVAPACVALTVPIKELNAHFNLT